MENRFKKFIVILWAVIFAVSLCAVPTAAETGGTACLKAIYQNQPVAGIELKLYYCAELDDTGCTFVGDFKDSPIASMPTSVDEWNTLAVGFEGVVSKNGTTPDAVMSSDQKGEVTFTSLKPGIYYIPGAVLKTADMTYATQPFFFSITKTNTAVDAKLKITGQPGSDNDYRRVLKVWNDHGDTQARPESITVFLYQNGAEYDSVELSKANNWSYDWVLPTGYNWSVSENTPDGYTCEIDRVGYIFTITNTPIPDDDKIVRSVQKVWNDGGDVLSRPESITVILYKNGAEYDTVVLSEENDWHYSWVLPEGYDWTVKEAVPNGYTSEITLEGTTFKIKNTPNPPEDHIVRSVHKVWNDNGDTASRPESIKVTLYRNGSEYETVELSEKNDWHYSWTLPAGYEWTVKEEVPNGYTSSTTFDGTTFEIVNTPDSDDGYTVRSVHKVWNDSGNTASRPESIKVILYQNDEEYERVELSEKNDWRYSWTLPEGYYWTVKEEVPNGYTSQTTFDGAAFEIVNTPNPEEDNIVRSVYKVWNDNGDTASRPESIKVTLYRNGSEYETVELSEKNDWHYSWILPEGYDWTVKEAEPSGYTSSTTFDGTAFTIVNTPDSDDDHIVRSVHKVWNDNGDTASRPESIKVTLYRNGSEYETVELSEKNDWRYSWVLPIGYDWTVKEAVPGGYTSSTTFDGTTFEIVNTPNTEEDNIVRSVHKVWNDNGDTASRPESIKVTLYRNGSEYQTVELSEKNDWSYSWTLPAGYDWTVKEEVPTGYTSQTTFDGTVFTIVNTPNPSENNVVRSVRKVWNDNDDTASRPESITVILYQNDTEYETVTLSENNGWRYSWVLPEGYDWTVKEAVPNGYTSSTTFDGTTFEIVNTPNPEENHIVRNVRKVWNDNGDTASRPENIKVILYQDGTEYETVELSVKNDWQYSWVLPEGFDWTVKEAEITGYTSQTTFAGETFTIVNTPNPPENKIVRNVCKVWNDNSDTASRPERITVILYKDGAEFAAVELSEENGWRYSWVLPDDYDWTVSEVVPDGYSASTTFDGTTYEIVNTPDSTENKIVRNVHKVWNDNGDAASRPESITVILCRNDTEYETVELSEKNDWRYSWVFPEGYDWSVRECTPDGYVCDISFEGDTFTVTNTKTPTPPPPDTPPTPDNPPHPYNPPTPYNPPHLPQTGLIWWPIIAFWGVAVLAFAIAFRFRHKKNNEKE